MINLAYILAASHSGSTLLSMLLGSHPEICTVGELKITPSALGDIDQYRCSCRKPILECPFWQKVHKEMARRSFEFDLTNSGTDFRGSSSIYAQRLSKVMHRGVLFELLRDVGLWFSPAWRKYYKRTQQRNVALMETVLSISGGKIIVDSSKAAVRLKYLLKNHGINIKVIRLIRDGRGVALTYMDPAKFADAKDPALRCGGYGNRGKELLSITQAAYQWRRNNEEVEHIVCRLAKSQWIEIRYEELCRDTTNTIGLVFRFLELDPGNRAKDFRSVEQHIVGNGMRLDTTSQIRLDERWRSVLADDDLRVFDRVAGEMNRRYGYE